MLYQLSYIHNWKIILVIGVGISTMAPRYLAILIPERTFTPEQIILDMILLSIIKRFKASRLSYMQMNILSSDINIM